MPKTVDTRRLSCPQPVLMTLDEIKAGGADEIIVMNRGRIVQRGTHEGMKNKEGYYKHLMKE